MTADQFVTADGAAQFSDFVAALGVSPESVSMALAVDPSHVQSGSLTALQADGILSAADLLAALVATDPNQPSTTDVSVAEKAVVRLGFSGAPSLLAYPRGDVLFIAAADDEESAANWLAELE